MKKLKLGIGLVIVIVLGCWVASRWHTWFVEEDEDAYVVSSSPAHVLLTFGDAQPLSRNVSWQAGLIASSVPHGLNWSVWLTATPSVWRRRVRCSAHEVGRLLIMRPVCVTFRLAPVMPIVPLLARRFLPGISSIRSQTRQIRCRSCM